MLALSVLILVFFVTFMLCVFFDVQENSRCGVTAWQYFGAFSLFGFAVSSLTMAALEIAQHFTITVAHVS